MFEYLYEWIRNIAYYMVLVTAVMQIIPNHDYKKYIRFFTGMVLILLLMTPVLKLFGMEQKFSELYEGKKYEEEIKEIEDSTQYLEELDIADYFPKEYSEKQEDMSDQTDENVTSDIGVEEVQIGQ